MHFGVRQTQIRIQFKSKLKIIEIISISRSLGPGMCRWVWYLLRRIEMGENLIGSAVEFQIPFALDSGRAIGAQQSPGAQGGRSSCQQRCSLPESGSATEAWCPAVNFKCLPCKHTVPICPEELSPKACLS